jgi:hypothetical protein
MKKYLFAIALLSFTGAAYSQSFNLGIRTGMNRYYTKMNSNDAYYNCWNKEIAGRYETNNGLAYEISLSNFSWKDGYGLTRNRWGQDNARGYTYSDYWYQEKNNHFVLNTSVQYDIICPKIKEHCPAMKRFSNYMGITVGLMKVYTKETVSYIIEETSEHRDRRSYNTNTNLVLGMINNLVYRHSNKVSFTATIGANAMRIPTLSYGYAMQNNLSDRNTTINASIGIQYKL